MKKFFAAIRKIAKIRFFAGLLLVGLLFTVLSTFILAAPKTERIAAEATIREIKHEYTGDDDHYWLIISFTDQNGNTHENVTYEAYSSGMKVGQTVAIEYDADDPESVSSPGGEFLPYIILIVGIGCVVVSVFCIVKAIRKSPEEENELDRVDMTAVDAQTLESIRNSTEPTYEYYFHFTGKLNQSYIMETPQRTPIFKADCDKITLLRPYIFTFENCRTGQRDTHEISHTVTRRYGADAGSVTFSVPTSSEFKIDGVNNWTVLGKMGYSLEPQRKGIKLNFELLHYGIRVGYLEAAGTNILKDGATNPLGDALPGTGLYKVTCRTEDIEGAFMACFCASRVEFF